MRKLFRFISTNSPAQLSTRRGHRRRRYSAELLESRALLTLSVPALSSLPGAAHTVFLDYDGQTVEGTSWNSYYNQTTLVAPAYNTDGDAASFSSAELTRIEESFHRVAEDFRPFNINVTTIDPGVDALRKSGSGDSKWGVRVIMTNEAGMVTDPAERTGAGGIAYINSFNLSSDTPVLVYTTGGKSIAEAASHEVGHSLGLSHDGTSSSSYYRGHGSGETGWASIMGVGYYQNVSQWDNGEYFDSNNTGTGANYGSGESDLAIIVGKNGFGFRADDHGDSNLTATRLSVLGTTATGDGVIETASDVDVYSFTTGSGLVTLNIDPFTPGPNLDVQADLYDSTGALVASSNPTAALNASFSLNVNAGQYFLHIDGTGVGTPTANPPTGYTDYASLGQYSITGTVVDAGSQPELSIASVSVNEFDGTADVTVTVTGSVTSPVSVDYSTSDASATAGNDYSSASGLLTFTAAGSQVISVNIVNDSVVEGIEDFNVDLSNATGAILANARAVVSIVDNDAAISINDNSINEGNLQKGKKNSGNSSIKNLLFTVSLSNAVAAPVTVGFSTSDGTATVANSDYKATSGSITFAPGEVTRTVSVEIVGDNTSEGDESFIVTLANVFGADVADGSATGTILEDDTKSGGGGSGRGRKNKIVLDSFWYFEGGTRDQDQNNDDRFTTNGPQELTFRFTSLDADKEQDETPAHRRIVQTVNEPLVLSHLAIASTPESSTEASTIEFAMLKSDASESTDGIDAEMERVFAHPNKLMTELE